MQPSAARSVISATLRWRVLQALAICSLAAVSILCIAEVRRASPSPALAYSDPQSSALPSNYTDFASLLHTAAPEVADVWDLGRVADICGSRMVGSPGLDCATKAWKELFEGWGSLDKVYTQPVADVGIWWRCRNPTAHGLSAELAPCERVSLVSPRPAYIHAVGFGCSPATPGGKPLRAELFVVGAFGEIAGNCSKIQGRVVVMNERFHSYEEQESLRGLVAEAGAACGAVAALVNSVGFGKQNPEAGDGCGYGKTREGSMLPIPALAISREDAELLYRLAHVHRLPSPPVVEVYTEGARASSMTQHNLIAELTGAIEPHRFVVVGGHLDSWDNPGETGATDDGTGTWAAFSALKTIATLVKSGLLPRPRRSIRYVGWVDEENAQAGGRAYAKAHGNETAFALESDSGNWQTLGNAFCGSRAAEEIMKQVVALNAPIGAGNYSYAGKDGCEADTQALVDDGVPTVSVEDASGAPGGTYLIHHHSSADTFSAVLDSEAGAKQSVASIATIAYVMADLRTELPRHSRLQRRETVAFLKKQ